ncbi:sugar phosphate isomerase/epimerase family protein [Cyclobacterium jeungdonense]|uniref:Sugar phosphate isomerase/epimerase n=1 Tax=Cyclobacterium jeungdonense TaxID=708087 RepID=A0ABT8C4K9_9BACT|nr:sugar phosphate isomerase/epimerase [Cyclobacterium jeungdonense]MDN3687700.1 sugar phosphate isomerase/epimerase [Cyclobacterium jeungdonense]
MLKLGFVSAILAEKSFEEVIDFAAAEDFSCVEMMCWPKGKAERRYAGVTHIDVAQLDTAQINHIREYQREKKVFVSGLGFYPNPMDPDESKAEAALSHIKAVVDGAEKLGIPVVNTFIGRNPSLNMDDNLKMFAERFPAVVKHASKKGIRIGIENCPMFFTNDEWPGGKNLAISPAIWEKMFSIIPDPQFGLNYDPSHLVWMQMDPVQPLYEFRDRLHHIHLKDVKLYPEKLNRVGILANPLEYHSPKIPGLGDVPWGRFFAALTDVGYRGPCCIEVEDKAFEKSPEDVKMAILTARNYLRQFIPIA